MVRIRVGVDPEGCLNHIEMTGHVSSIHGNSGANTVCAAVTGLVRSGMSAIAASPLVDASGSAESEGRFEADVRPTAGAVEWLRGVTDVLLCGLDQMKKEAPGEMDLEITRPGGKELESGTQKGRRKQ